MFLVLDSCRSDYPIYTLFTANAWFNLREQISTFKYIPKNRHVLASVLKPMLYTF